MGAAMVTGGAKRLGAAMALALAERGLDVAINYASSEAAATETVAAIESKGVRAVALKANLLNDSETQALIGRAGEALGQPITVLVNNASIFEHDTLETATLEGWDRHMSSNLKAPFLLTQAFARQVPKGVVDAEGYPIATGNVVNMVDQRVRKLTPEFMTYTLAKMGLWAFTRTAAQALAPDIRVNGIGPGPTLQGGRQTAEHFSKQKAATLLQRGANPDAICNALCYILDSHSMTGQLLAIDGGQHLGWQTPDVIGVE